MSRCLLSSLQSQTQRSSLLYSIAWIRSVIRGHLIISCSCFDHVSIRSQSSALRRFSLFLVHHPHPRKKYRFPLCPEHLPHQVRSVELLKYKTQFCVSEPEPVSGEPQKYNCISVTHFKQVTLSSSPGHSVQLQITSCSCSLLSETTLFASCQLRIATLAITTNSQSFCT